MQKQKKPRPIRVRDAKSARRLLSRILLQLQRERFNVAVARAEVNCVSEFLSVLRTSDFEERLSAVEQTIQGSNYKGGRDGQLQRAV
jgi:uncharacterized protein YlxP (DUF503 family)